ncbi:MAG: hypothetical protein AAF950_00630 [Pseudomonadota bacterium]
MVDVRRITVRDIVGDSYAYMRAAVLPALTGSVLYAVTSSGSDLLRTRELAGQYSMALSIVILFIMATIWLALALRQGLGKPRKGVFGLYFGFDEIRLGSSMLGFASVMAIVLFLLGFAVFLLVMIVAVAGAGALGGNDVAEAELFTSPDAFNDFLVSGGAGTFVAIAGGGIIVAAAFLFVWLVIRLLPFAAGTIDQRRFIVLQAAIWTRYQDRALLMGAVLTIGVGIGFVWLARYGISLSPLPDLPGALLKHVVSCFGALLLIGFICSVYKRLVVEFGTEDAAEVKPGG